MENGKNNVIPMFGRAATLAIKGQTKPHLGAFLNEIGVTRQKSPVTFEVLKDIFECDCNKNLCIEAISENYKNNVELYKRRIDVVQKRMKLMDPKVGYSDTLIAIALNDMRCRQPFSTHIPKPLSDKINNAANRFRGFLNTGMPTQDDFNQLKSYEKFLVVDYVLDLFTEIEKLTPKFDFSNSSQIKQLTNMYREMNKFKNLSYSSCGKSIYSMIEIKSKMLKAEKARLFRQIDPSSKRKISQFPLHYYNLR